MWQPALNRGWQMNKKGAVQAQLTAAYKTERQTLRGRVQQEEPGRCRCRNRTRTGKLTPARHRWPCRCPSKRTVVGLSPAPSAGILHPESGCDKNNKRRAVTPCQGAAAAPCLQSCCRALKRLSVQREAALGDPVIPSEQAEKTLTRSRPKRATGGPLAHLTAGGLPGNDSGNNSG